MKQPLVYRPDKLLSDAKSEVVQFFKCSPPAADMNSFHVLELVGEGSFGRVYKGRKRFTGQVSGFCRRMVRSLFDWSV